MTDGSILLLAEATADLNYGSPWPLVVIGALVWVASYVVSFPNWPPERGDGDD